MPLALRKALEKALTKWNSPRRHWPLLVGAILLMVPLTLYLRGSSAVDPPASEANDEPTDQSGVTIKDGMAWIPAGEYLMGSSDGNNRDQWPVHRVATSGFWIDTLPVTNAQFREFVIQTGYVTTAEQRGSSLVFVAEAQAWQQVAGATWKTPTGTGSTLLGKSRHPVVHVSWDDANAYAQWAGKRLATEAEYERAARGGLLGQRYAWGDELAPDNKPMANFWQGRFPYEDRGLDRFAMQVAPVGRYPRIATRCKIWRATSGAGPPTATTPSSTKRAPHESTRRQHITRARPPRRILPHPRQPPHRRHPRPRRPRTYFLRCWVSVRAVSGFLIAEPNRLKSSPQRQR